MSRVGYKCNRNGWVLKYFSTRVSPTLREIGEGVTNPIIESNKNHDGQHICVMTRI